MIAVFYDRKHGCEVTSAQLGSTNVVASYVRCEEADDAPRPKLSQLRNWPEQIGELGYKSPECGPYQNWDRFLMTQDLVFLRLEAAPPGSGPDASEGDHG